MYRQQQEFNALMNEPGKKRNIMKILLCGYGGNGKTTLKHALQRSFIEAKLLQRSKEKAPSSEKEEYEPTPGIDMATVNISKAGKFGIWDFAGQTEYYVTHNMFLSAENSIFTVVFKITDTPEKQKSEVISWLSFIKAIIMKTIAKGQFKPTVILVASRADQLKKGTRKKADALYREIQLEAKKMFGEYLNILDETFILNCHDSQHRDMNRLRTCIKLAKREEFVPKICEEIRGEKPGWIVSTFPVIKWNSYVQKVKAMKAPADEEEIGSIGDEEPLKRVTKFLQYLGEILYIESTLTRGGDIIVLDPQWLCTRVIGPMLAPETFVKYTKRLTKKMIYSRSDIEVVFQDFADIDSLIDLLKELELVFEVAEQTPGGTVISDPENVSYYSIGQIKKAEQKNKQVLDKRKTKSEEVSDLLCRGYDAEVLRSLGYQSDVKWMLQSTRKQFSIIMDRRRNYGGDYRMMADLMGFERAEVASWEENYSKQSITQHILSEWSKRWAMRNQDDGILSEADCIYESTFTNLVKILRHKDCCVDIARKR
ncbi:death-associated protein kinase 1-like [Ptychodera flava]|uniref:death-associated protein kinase 1-like n=1 Tax=Ptychodera flava TaxID=63121 RepID=UPI00396AA576